MFFLAVYIHMFRSLFLWFIQIAKRNHLDTWDVNLSFNDGNSLHGICFAWGQMSFWGATVITNLFSAIPLVGESIVTWLWGGYSVDNPTLTRFFSLHYLFPFLILGLVVLHIWALHVPGNNNPIGIDIKTIKGYSSISSLHNNQRSFCLTYIYDCLFRIYIFCTKYSWP